MTRERQPLTLGDVVMWLLVVAVVVLVYLCASGCRSATPLPDTCPEPEVVTVQVPAPCVVPVAVLPSPDLPAYPTHPGHDADEVEWKAWALLVAEVAEQREAILRARVDAYTRKVLEHNGLEPRCGEPVP
jgi:hypothetical protein